MTWFDALIGLMLTIFYLTLAITTEINDWLLFCFGIGMYLIWMVYVEHSTGKNQ